MQIAIAASYQTKSSDPPLHLGRLRPGQQLTEIRLT